MHPAARISALMAALSIPFPVHAVDDEAIIVTATRTARTVDETLAAVTVISREQIEREQAQSVQDLLRATAGLTVTNNGGLGKNTSVFLRGTESDQILVLIDGVKVGSATSGSTPFQDLPVELIERIEIVRGPRSSLYGSEAIGGVIQIFTRKGGGDFRPAASIGAGSDKTYSASASLSGGSDQSWFTIGASGIDTGGFNACRGSASAGCFTNEPDKDGYSNLSANLRVGHRFGGGTEVDFHALRTDGNSEFDGGSQNESESSQQVIGGTLRLQASQAWTSTLSLGTSQDVSDNFKDGVFSSRFKTTRDTVSWQNDLAIGSDHLMTVGISGDRDKVDSTTAFAVNSRNNTGVFGQYQGNFGASDVQLSARNDDNEQFGNHGTGGASWGYAFDGGTRLFVSYGTAFKAPTFNELYFPSFGNSALQPETAKSTEIGASGHTGSGHWNVNVFETQVDNLIAFDASISAPNNVDEARLRGIEISTGTRRGPMSAEATLTLLDPENRASGANFGKVLPRRAEESLRMNLDHDFGQYRFGATVIAEGRRYDDLANTRRLAGYATMDLRAEYFLNKDLRLQGRVENLFDKQYETASFFNQPGRGVFVTLRYQP